MSNKIQPEIAKILDEKSAFPAYTISLTDTTMSKRDWFAAIVLNGLIANEGLCRDTIDNAICFADEMIAALKATEQQVVQ